MKTNWKYITLFFSSLLVSVTFQNCMNRRFTTYNIQDYSSLGMDHPDSQPINTAHLNKSMGTVSLIDRIEMSSVFSDVFLNQTATPPETALFNNLLQNEILTQQHMFGHPCDLLSNPSDCGGNTGNLNLSMTQSSSTIREASRLQLCRRLIANDSIFLRLMNRLKGIETTPSRESLTKIVQLFYPAWENYDDIITSLEALDYKMALESETVLNRWRTMVLVVCESPFWEVL